MSQGSITASPPVQPGAPTSPIRVLVIDDEEPVRRIIKLALTKQGCVVETAANGRQGLHLLLRTTFDAAVVDIRMQEMDGLAFVQEARKIWPWLGVVLYSGFVDEQIEAIAAKVGVRRVLTKPVDMKLLGEAVTEAATRRDGAAQGVPQQLIRYQLAMMRHITSDTLHARSLSGALASLGQTITQMLPCHMLGILAIEEDENVLLLKATAPLPPAAGDQLRDHMVERYRVLSGNPLESGNLRIERIGPDPEVSGRGLDSIVAVPVMMGEEVHGLLTLASCEADAFDETQVTLLYHAAGHLSTLLGAFAEIRRLATRDPLTGLYNRLQLEEELTKFWSLAARHRKPMAVLMLDIDQFKSINDLWGHQSGDAIIREFGEFLRATVRTSDIVARYGGDEFVLILPHADTQEAVNLASRLLGLVRGRTFLNDKEPLTLSTSIGIAVHDPERHPIEKSALIDLADQALYRAKKDGRDRFHLWNAAVSRTAETAGSVLEPDAAPPATERKGRILAVDDEPYIQIMLQRMLEEEGYEVLTAGTIHEAQQLLEREAGKIDLTLCDISLPDGDGHELLLWCRSHDRLMVTLVISGNVTADNAILALRNGAFDFIQKPMTPRTLAVQIERAFRYRALQKENARYHLYLEEMVRAKNSELSKALDEIKVAYEFTLETMVAMLDAREFETGQHSVRVRDLTLVLARTMGIEGRQLEEIGRGALLHDIGKIGIPDSILLKPGKLTEDEWEVMRRHPVIGHRFLTNSTYLKTAAALVLSHHERWDGRGYPQGLSGEEISLGARIFAVIDAYDAMRSSRVYKHSVSMEKAVAEIRDKSGSQFDPAIVEAFLQCVPEMEKIGRWSASFTPDVGLP
ncbi:MAG TPA: diguanylate cyclase [Kiritimatiellia bacterium]|nr:diguanylate cyclase [Kiritimatiellia bacterium]HMP33696.1 diguanylate cyclase [Kiritimatiellia bacterium]